MEFGKQLIAAFMLALAAVLEPAVTTLKSIDASLKGAAVIQQPDAAAPSKGKGKGSTTPATQPTSAPTPDDDWGDTPAVVATVVAAAPAITHTIESLKASAAKIAETKGRAHIKNQLQTLGADKIGDLKPEQFAQFHALINA